MSVLLPVQLNLVMMVLLNKLVLDSNKISSIHLISSTNATRQALKSSSKNVTDFPFAQRQLRTNRSVLCPCAAEMGAADESRQWRHGHIVAAA